MLEKFGLLNSVLQMTKKFGISYVEHALYVYVTDSNNECPKNIAKLPKIMQVNLQQEKILNAQKHSKTPLKRRNEIHKVLLVLQIKTAKIYF